MSDLDLVLLDTAGRSPKDEVKIQELKAFLTEAQADEVHLVLSSVAGASTLRANRRALRRRRHDAPAAHQAGRSHGAGQSVAAAALQSAAA